MKKVLFVEVFDYVDNERECGEIEAQNLENRKCLG